MTGHPLYSESIAPGASVDFAGRLQRETGRPVALVGDNLRAHCGRKAQRWLEEQAGLVAVRFLSAYPPEPTPDDHLNNASQRSLGSRGQARGGKELADGAKQSMDGVQNNPKQ